MPLSKDAVSPFHGGLHLDGHKAESTGVGISDLPLAEVLHIPVSQHAGVAGELLVAVGDQVLSGQPLTQTSATISAVVHASSSGVITAIENHAVVNRSGQQVLSITIKTDGVDKKVAPLPPLKADENKDLLLERLHACGVVGLGGATFPTAVKVGTTHPIDTLIINAVECEPYISCDDMLMREQPDRILQGAELLRALLGANRILVGIEDNKPEAIAAMQAAATAAVDIIVVATIYPSGGEKQLIKLLTGKEVPSGGLPSELGMVCVNTATAAASYDAIALGLPLTERIVTVTGNEVEKAANYRARIGTPITKLLEHAQAKQTTKHRYRMGGPLMGVVINDLESPVVKATNCILSEKPEAAPAEQACIRCGDCVTVCPANLLPQQLYWYTRATEFDKAEQHGLFDCIECGCCDYVCPSHIPLVDYYRHAKFESNNIRSERTRSDRARVRFETRETRLQRKADEKAALRAAKVEKLKAREAKQAGNNDKQDEIAAALARVKAKKQQADD